MPNFDRIVSRILHIRMCRGENSTYDSSHSIDADCSTVDEILSTVDGRQPAILVRFAGPNTMYLYWAMLCTMVHCSRHWHHQYHWMICMNGGCTGTLADCLNCAVVDSTHINEHGYRLLLSNSTEKSTELISVFSGKNLRCQCSLHQAVLIISLEHPVLHSFIL